MSRCIVDQCDASALASRMLCERHAARPETVTLVGIAPAGIAPPPTSYSPEAIADWPLSALARWLDVRGLRLSTSSQGRVVRLSKGDACVATGFGEDLAHALADAIWRHELGKGEL